MARDTRPNVNTLAAAPYGGVEVVDHVRCPPARAGRLVQRLASGHVPKGKPRPDGPVVLRYKIEPPR